MNFCGIYLIHDLYFPRLNVTVATCTNIYVLARDYNTIERVYESIVESECVVILGTRWNHYAVSIDVYVHRELKILHILYTQH